MSLTMFTPRQVSIGAILGSQTQYSRTYSLNATGSNVNDLLKHTSNGLDINVNTIVNGSGIMAMSSDAHAEIDIDGGWQEPRHVFELILESNTTGSLFILTGFTSTDYMLNGRINPRAEIHFNTYTEMAPQQQPDGSIQYMAMSTDNIMAATDLKGNLELNRSLSVTPTHVLAASSMYGMGNDNMTTIGQHDTCASTARNNQAAAWLGRTIDSYVTQMDSMDMSGQGAHGYMRDGAASVVANHASHHAAITETDLAQAAFIGSLLSNYHDMSAGALTWGYLLEKLPQIQHLIRPPLPAGGGSQIKLEEWNNRDTAIIISEYASAIPALMLECGVKYFNHTVTNVNSGMNLDPFNTTACSYRVNGDANNPGVLFSVDNAKEMELLNMLQVRITNMIFPRISRGHKMTISCEASKLTNMTIAVDWNGYTFAHTAATFASSKWSAMSANINSSTDLANGVGKLGNALIEARRDNPTVSAQASSSNTSTSVVDAWSK